MSSCFTVIILKHKLNVTALFETLYSLEYSRLSKLLSIPYHSVSLTIRTPSLVYPFHSSLISPLSVFFQHSSTDHSEFFVLSEVNMLISAFDLIILPLNLAHSHSAFININWCTKRLIWGKRTLIPSFILGVSYDTTGTPLLVYILRRM